MKSKFNSMWRVTVALVLVLSLGLVMAAPVAASPDVSNVWVDLDNYSATTSDTYNVYFTPGADLTAGTDTINLIFPSGTDASGATSAKVYPDGDLIADPTFTNVTEITRSETRVTVTTPVDISAGVEVRLDISSVVNPPAGEKTLDLYTTQELTRVTSRTYTIEATAVINVFFVTDPATAGDTAKFTVDFDSSATGALGDGWGKVTVIFPPEVTLPASMLATDVAFDGNADSTYTDCDTAPVIEGRLVTVTVSEDLGTTSTGSIEFKKLAAIKNPETMETYAGKLSTLTDAQIVDSDTYTTVVAGDIAQLVFDTELSDGLVEVDEAATLVVETQDAHGNVKAVAEDITLELSSTSTTGLFDALSDTGDFEDDEDLMEEPSDTSETFYYKDSTAGSFTISITAKDDLGVELDLTVESWDITVEAAHAVALYDSNGVLIDDTYTTIQDAIEDAMAGDTIKVGPGMYAEDLSISTPDLIIESTGGAASTTIEGGMTLSATADDFVLGGAEGKGFTLNGGTTHLIWVQGPTDVEISYNTLDTGNDVEESNAIKTQGVATSRLKVTHNDFIVTDLYDMGVRGHKDGPVDGLTVTNNTFTGVGSTLDHAAIEINNLDISSTDSTISGNIITTIGSGVIIGDWTGVYGLVCGNSEDPAVDGELVINDNTFDDCNYGIDLVNATATGNQNVVITRNTFSNNTIGLGINKGECVVPGDDKWQPADFTVQFNDFSGNTYGAYNNADNTTSVLVATNNYWDDVTGPSTDPDALTPTAYGEGDPISAKATFSPWLSKSQSECVIASYPALSVELSTGWNTLSAPAKLISTADAIDELVTAGISLAYSYDDAWVPVTTGYVLNPGDAVYLKMSSTQTVLFQVDGAITWVPSKDLAAGWNLIGLAKLTPLQVSNAVASVGDSYAQVVSPSMNDHDWVHIYGQAYTDPAADPPDNLPDEPAMLIGEGYWIFMKSEATLGGFTLCPIVPQY